MHLIFDFDGTLVDSLNCVMRTYNVLADKYNFCKIASEEINNLRNLTSKEFIKHLRIPLYKIPKIIQDARKLVQQEIHTLTPFRDLPASLHALKNAGFTLGIVTSNSIENVNAWLQQHELLHLFDFTHSESNFFGKKRVLNKIAKLYNFDKSRMYYFGDETRDVEAANAGGILSVAVTWGFNSEQALQRAAPRYIVRSPQEILQLFGI